MTTVTRPATTPARRDRTGRRARTVVPVPRPAPDDVPGPVASPEEWVTYPGVHYALEHLGARARTAADGDRAGADRG